jgi:radical SAM protein with 4Fe4S-binding SPASM domain
MIDQQALRRAFAQDGFYALQLEVGDRCEQGCSYCYMNALPEEHNTLSDALVGEILADARDLGMSAIEWLGGEPLLRPSIWEHMGAARDRGLRNNMWTGGLPLADPVAARRCAELCRHGLISIHLSTLNPKLYAALHPVRPVSDLDAIVAGLGRLLDLGYPAEQMLNSVTLTGVQPADDMIATVDELETRFGVRTSLNVYHTYLRPGAGPKELARFIPSARAVSRVSARLARQWGVRHLPMNCVDRQYCSATVAVLCDGSVTPCATIRESGAPSVHERNRFAEIVRRHRDHLCFRRLKEPENLPGGCAACQLAEVCWGCRSRAFAAGLGLEGPDPRCFRRRRRPAG